jgi:hypothetical protein
MKKPLIATFLLFLSALPAMAQSPTEAPPADQTTVHNNGTSWVDASLEARLNYINGYVDGAASVGQRAETDCELEVAMHTGIKTAERKSGIAFCKTITEGMFRKEGISPTYGEIQKAVTEFYQIPENLPVCWAAAVDYEWMSLTGNAYPTTEWKVSSSYSMPTQLETIRKAGGSSGCSN